MFSFCVCHNKERVISVSMLSIAILVLRSVYESASFAGALSFFWDRRSSFHTMRLGKSFWHQLSKTRPICARKEIEPVISHNAKLRFNPKVALMSESDWDRFRR